MDAYTSNPALLANSELFRRYMGRRVRTVVKVGRFEGGNLYAQAPDGPQISIRQVVKNEEFTQFVEVIGVVEGENTLRSEVCTNFGDKFGMFSLLSTISRSIFNFAMS